MGEAITTAGDGWIVSDSHGVMRPHRDGDRLQPFARAHARRPGEPYTACGVRALNWRMFWDTPFRPGEPGTCDRCSAALENLRRPAEQRGGPRS